MAQQLMFQLPPEVYFESRHLGHTWKTWKQQFGIFLITTKHRGEEESVHFVSFAWYRLRGNRDLQYIRVRAARRAFRTDLRGGD